MSEMRELTLGEERYYAIWRPGADMPALEKLRVLQTVPAAGEAPNEVAMVWSRPEDLAEADEWAGLLAAAPRMLRLLQQASDQLGVLYRMQTNYGLVDDARKTIALMRAMAAHLPAERPVSQVPGGAEPEPCRSWPRTWQCACGQLAGGTECQKCGKPWQNPNHKTARVGVLDNSAPRVHEAYADLGMCLPAVAVEAWSDQERHDAIQWANYEHLRRWMKQPGIAELPAPAHVAAALKAVSTASKMR